MSVFVEVFSTAFAVLSVAALVFFVHKVVWLWRYKRIEQQLLDRAASELTGHEKAVAREWALDQETWWAELTEGHPGGPVDVANRAEARLGIIGQSAKARAPGAEELLESAAGSDLKGGTVEHKILVIPEEGNVSAVARLRLNNVTLTPPVGPETSIYKLERRSRYGFIRRALVFCAGIADVVYSSAHISNVLSRHTHVPFSLILRRLLLVIVLVLGLASQVLFGARDEVEELLLTTFREPLTEFANTFSMPIPPAATAVAFVIVSGGVTLIYFALYLFLRFRSQRQLSKLSRLRDEVPERLAEFQTRATGQLTEWARDYGRTLDAAVDLTVRRIDTLRQDLVQRLHDRIATGILRKEAESMSRFLVEALPETSLRIQDTLSLQRHGFLHLLWPRAREMTAAISQAQYRAAWQDIELTLAQLSQEDMGAHLAFRLWQKLGAYIRCFPSLFTPAHEAELRKAYRAWAKEIWEGGARDARELNHELAEAIGYLNHELDTALPLLEARAQACQEQMRASCAQLQSEAIAARERARLEAMAFEI